MPYHSPVRPMPVCTSSAIITVPLSSHRSRTPLKNSAEAVWTPLSPWMGSTIRAATSFVIISLTLSRSPNLKYP